MERFKIFRFGQTQVWEIITGVYIVDDIKAYFLSTCGDSPYDVTTIWLYNLLNFGFGDAHFHFGDISPLTLNESLGSNKTKENGMDYQSVSYIIKALAIIFPHLIIFFEVLGKIFYNPVIHYVEKENIRKSRPSGYNVDLARRHYYSVSRMTSVCKLLTEWCSLL